MSKIKGLWTWLKAMFQTGKVATWDGDMSLKEKDWIRYEDIYIQVLKGDDGYSIAWTWELPEHYPLKDMLIAKKKGNQ